MVGYYVYSLACYICECGREGKGEGEEGRKG